jgi:hypothetical protein
LGVAASYNSPALTVQNGVLYLSFNDANNTNWLTNTLDGVNWSQPYQLAPGYTTTWAPALAAGDYIHNATKIYAGFADASTYTPVICNVYPNTYSLPSSTQVCFNFTSLAQMNFNPGLVGWADVGGDGVVMGYEWRGNTHCNGGYILNPETQYSYNYDAAQSCSDQTSVSPSLAVYPQTDRLFFAWGGNNSARQFNVRLTDPSEIDLIYKQTMPQYMNGQPDLLAISPPNYYPELVNFYVWNGQARYLFGTY